MDKSYFYPKLKIFTATVVIKAWHPALLSIISLRTHNLHITRLQIETTSVRPNLGDQAQTRQDPW